MAHPRRSLILAATAAVLLFAGLANLPVAQAASMTDTFESYASGKQPCTTATFSPPCTNAYGSYSIAGTSPASQVSTTLAHSGSKSLQMVGGSITNAYQFATSASGQVNNLCYNGGVDVWLAFTAVPSASTSNRFVSIRPSSPGGNHYTEFFISPSGFSWSVGSGAAVLIQYSVDGGTPSGQSFTFTNSFALNHFYEFGLACANGNDGAPQASVYGGEAGSPPTTITAPSNAAVPFVFNNAVYFSGGTTEYLDDLTLNPQSAQAGALFCANIFDNGNGSTDQGGGYEYNKGVDLITDANSGDSNTISFSDFFKFLGGSSGTDTLAKHFNPGSKAFHVISRLEADTDATSSVFRVALTYDNTAVPTDTLRGNGLTTQLFTTTLEVDFTETGNSWQIQFYAVDAGTRTPLGSAVQYGSPNDPMVFTFWADTQVSAQGPANAYFGAQGGSIQQGPYVAMTVPVPDGSGHANQIVAYRSLAAAGSTAISSDFQDKVAYDQWYLGYGTGSILSAVTGLDSTGADQSGNIATSDSTCIFDDVGGAVVGTGGSGITPSSQVPTPTSSSTSTTSIVGIGGPGQGFGTSIFGGLVNGFADGMFGGSLTAGRLMVSIIVILGFAGIGYDVLERAPKLGALAGAILGLVLSVAIGLFPVWPIVVAVVLGLAYVWYRTRG